MERNKKSRRPYQLDEYVVMPNHVHGILILNGNRIGTVGTTHALSLPPIPDAHAQSRFQNQGKNTLSSIIGSYKSAVSKHAHRLGFDFAWQSRFHDHIIRNEEEYQRIANYIRVNPANWKEDKFF